VRDMLLEAGGKIDLVGPPAQGTTVRILLPLAMDGETAQLAST